MQKTKHVLKGFTLIELLIVITIIGILAVALMPSVLGAPARARDAARKADLSNLTSALELYNSDHQGYPTGELCLGYVDAAHPGDVELNSYLTGGKAPADPQKGAAAQALGTCDVGQYLYCPLAAPYNYMLASYMEIAGDGNFAATGLASCPGSAPTPTTVTAPTVPAFFELK